MNAFFDKFIALQAEISREHNLVDLELDKLRKFARKGLAVSKAEIVALYRQAVAQDNENE